ncbi:MAG TPA: phosphodiester glycosidase family protein [Actinomycetota bacterium]
MPRTRSRAHAAVAVASVWLTAAATLASGGLPAHARPAARTSVIGPGLTYERIKDPQGPWVIHVVRLDPAQASTLDLAAGGPTMGAFSRPSEIGRARRALVAINGDFGLLSGHPLHPFAMDGSLMGRGAQRGVSFALTHDEAASYLGPEPLAIDGKDVTSGALFELAGWNSGKPDPGELAAYTRYGGRVEPVPGYGCAARLLPDGEMRWNGSGDGISRLYTVGARRCGEEPLPAKRRSVVLAARRWGVGATTLTEMSRGDTIRLSWSFGWRHVMDSIGGMPQVVDDGSNVGVRCAARFCRRHPRTGVGVTADGSVLLVVVDGRSERSVGMSLVELGRTFVSLGAVEALNLDGGGSSAMWIKGSGIVNRPSDPGGERAVVNAMVVLPGGDAGEGSLSLRRAPRVAVAHGLGVSDFPKLASFDPGSTGGLADAWIRGALGMSTTPPSSIVQAARWFRLRG